jgi:phosphatidylglycerol---prolipoprotein diacylglyceryl transferase
LFEPKIPYIELPEIPIAPAMPDLPLIGWNERLTIKPFGTLVAIGVYVGWLIVNRQAKRQGFALERFSQFIFWTLAGGFIGGHVFDVLLYRPDRLFDRAPVEALKELLFIWRSQASFGGFMGAILGMLVWRNRHQVKSILPYCDTMASSFPMGWVFGRTGCSVAHDHPGLRSEHWLAVRYPSGGRFDLGLIEMLVSIPLALSFFYFMRKPRPWGFYIGAMSVYYAPIRFCLDFLRARDVRDPDVRHFGLTPAQWLCIALFAVGVFFLTRALAAGRRGETPAYVGPGLEGDPDGVADPTLPDGDDEADEDDDDADEDEGPASSERGADRADDADDDDAGEGPASAKAGDDAGEGPASAKAGGDAGEGPASKAGGKGAGKKKAPRA